MKKLLITTLILFITLTSKAQEQFEGIWVSEGSTFKTTILTSEYSVMEVFNFSFVDNRLIKEKIKSKSKTMFTTTLYNAHNGYSVDIIYTMKDKNTLIRHMSGHLNKKITLTRYNKK